MKPIKPYKGEEGLTLIESLVGIMVVTVIITLITPPLIIAYASRLQNYRADQAMKLAQGEIERVRIQIERGDYDATKLPPSLAQTGAFNGDLDGIPAVDTNVKPPDDSKENLIKYSCPQLNVMGSDPNAVRRFCVVDINGDGIWDLAVQSFRSSTPPVTYEQANNKPVAFLMGVRVYSRGSIDANVLTPYPGRKTVSLGLKNGQSVSLPLVTRYVPIVKSDLNISRYAYCELNNSLNPNQAQACN